MRVFKLSGIVKKYSQMGRRLGYPTANIPVDPKTIEGLFLGYTYLRDQKLPSIIYIGAPETFNEKKKRAESYILDFPDHDLYGKQVTFEVVEKLRDNRKFESAEKLIEQMKQDEQSARHFFKL